MNGLLWVLILRKTGSAHFHPNNVKSSIAEVDSAQMVQYVIYIKMKTEVFQKRVLESPFKKSCFTTREIRAAKSHVCKRTKVGLG